MFIHPTPKAALKTALSVLDTAFDGVADVSAKMPQRLPSTAKFVRVDRVGGSRPNLVTDAARILIELYGPDPETVESMSGTADAAMHNAIGTVVDSVFIRDWTAVQGPTNFPHPDFLQLERWQMHGELWLSTTTPS